jgi:hypothetical protein
LSGANKADKSNENPFPNNPHTQAHSNRAITKIKYKMNSKGRNDDNGHNNTHNKQHEGDGYEEMEADLEEKIKAHEALKKQLAEINGLRALDQDKKRKRQRHNQPK